MLCSGNTDSASFADSFDQELSRLFKDPFTINLDLGPSLSSPGAGLDAYAGAVGEADAVQRGEDAGDKIPEVCARITLVGTLLIKQALQPNKSAGIALMKS